MPLPPVDADALEAAWVALGPVMEAHARIPVPLTSEDLGALSRGEVVRRRVSLPGADRALGALWTPTPRLPLWLCIQDDQDDKLVTGLVERHLPGTTPARKWLYQWIDLPWPFQDRQWVAEITNNHPLREASGGHAWERTWTLADPSLAGEADPAALWVPVNDGGWLLADLAGGSLLVYQVRTVVGGAIPDGLVTSWTLTTLSDMLQHIVDRAAVLPSHYVRGHPPLYGPDDVPVPPGG